MYDIDYQHVMLITGVHIENDKIVRWKIEDSYGDKVHKDGYYIMNDNFFDDFVIEVMIDKKYLSKTYIIWYEWAILIKQFNNKLLGEWKNVSK